jgi:hypothetical protein
VLGTRRSLDLAIAAVLLAFGMFFHAAPGDVPTLALLSAALIAWLAVLLPWRVSWSRRTSRDHQRGMYLALGAWALTDLVVLLAWG